jgi:integrase
MRFHLLHNHYGALNRNGEAPVYVEFSLGKRGSRSKRHYIKTDAYCHPEAWDKYSGTINHKDPNYAEKNLYLQSIVGKMWGYVSYHIQDNSFDVDEIKSLLGAPAISTIDKTKNSFLAFYERNILRSRKKENISIGTKHARNSTLLALRDYKQKIRFRDVTGAFVADFREYRFERGDSPNTIKKHLKHLKTFIYFARMDGLMSGELKDDPFKDVIVSAMKSNKKFALTFNEYDKFLNLNYEKGTELYHVWKMWIFASRTSLRISDLIDLQDKHILNTENGIVLIKESIKDSGGTYRVNLSKEKEVFGTTHALDILAEYKKEGKVFPKIDTSTLARAFDEINNDMGFTGKRITFHIARHTCATHLAAKGVNLWKIMNVGGWSSLNTVMGYMDMANEILGIF